MASRKEELQVNIKASDNASRVVDDVAGKLEALESAQAQVDVTADNQASVVLEDVEGELTDLDGRTAEATIDADVGSGIADAKGELVEIDGSVYSATVDAGVGAGLTGAEADLATIDGGTYKATVDASTGAGLTAAEADLKEIDGGTYRATVDASAGAGLTSILGDIDAVPGTLSQGMGVLSGAAGAGGAIGLAVGAMAGLVTQATNWGTEVGEVAALTGDTTEDVSGFLSIWQNAGYQKGDLLDVVAQMVGVLAQSPALAEELGIKLDGSMTPLEMLKTAIAGLNSGQLTANDRILKGSQLFGEEGVRQINGLTAMVEGDLTGAIEDVPEALILSEEQVQRAQDMRREFVELKSSLMGFANELGASLIPPLQTALGLVNDIEEATGVNPVEATSGPLGDPGSVGDVGRQIVTQRLLADAYDVTTGAWGDYIAQADDAADATDDVTDSTEDSTAALNAERDALIESRDALLEKIDAQREATDDVYAARDAERDFRDQIADTTETLADAEASADDQAEALDDLALAAADAADAQVDLLGDTASATAKIDAQNASLIASANQLDGPMQEAIVDYIGELNDIPDEVISDIKAALARHDIDEANRLLNEASATRTAAIEADAVQKDIDSVESALNHLARDRTVNIHTRGGGGGRGGPSAMASGGPVRAGTPYVVGERGQELFVPGQDGTIIPAGQTAAMLSGHLTPGISGVGSAHYDVNINMPPGSNGQDVLRALQQLQRQQGPLPIRVAG